MYRGVLADDTAVEAGFNFLVGLGFPEPFFAELKIGALDSPQVKIGVGLTFRCPPRPAPHISVHKPFAYIA